MVVALEDGTEIGGFELSGVIGRGGFGITYRAKETRTGDVYAIKEYLPEDFAQRESSGLVTSRPGHRDFYDRGKDSFMSEANILKDLPRREGLVRVRGAFEKFGTAYCVMEFIEGDSLDRMADRVINRWGYVPEGLLVDLAMAVLWALDALHAEHMIHRDVKPANIMLRRTGEPVVIDFGAARRLSRATESHAIFTRAYAAIEQFPPEQVNLGRNLEEGPWSDIYSLSVVLYKLIAQTRPPNAEERAKAVLAGMPDPYVALARQIAGSAYASKYSSQVLVAIDRGCELLPQSRTRSARELADQLRPGRWGELAHTRKPISPDIRSEGPEQSRSGQDRHASLASGDRIKRAMLLMVIAGIAALGLYLLTDARWGTETF